MIKLEYQTGVTIYFSINSIFYQFHHCLKLCQNHEQLRLLYTWTVIWLVTKSQSPGRPVAQARTLACSCSGFNSKTTRNTAMAPTTPLCPLSTVLAQMKDTNLDFEYEIDETTIWLVE